MNNLHYTTNNLIDWDGTHTDEKLIEYIQFLCDILGISIPDFENFKNMSNSERKLYIREKKIDSLLK